MLTWVIILLSFWVGYGCSTADYSECEGLFGVLAAIPTVLTILYLCLVALNLV